MHSHVIVKDLVFPRLDTYQECGLALFLSLFWIVVGVVIISIFYYSWKNFYFISVEKVLWINILYVSLGFLHFCSHCTSIHFSPFIWLFCYRDVASDNQVMTFNGSERFVLHDLESRLEMGKL
jgi:hypothetical protein